MASNIDRPSGWTPLWPHVAPRVDQAQPRGDLPAPNADGWIACHSPLREDRHPSFSIKPDSESDPGAWADHATGESGSIAELARRLGLDVRALRGGDPSAPVCSDAGKPRMKKSPRKIQGNGTASPPDLGSFAVERHLDPGQLRDVWRANPVVFSGRPALRFPTRVGVDRIKFTDGEKPKNRWAEKGGAAHLYGWGQAKKHGAAERLYLVNGEPSVWACAQAGVPAVCTCAGEGTAPTRDMIADLTEAGARQVAVVFDNDDEGRKGAVSAVAALRAGGLEAVALKLPAELGEHGDLDDLHRRVGDEDLAEALAGLPELREPEQDHRPPRGAGKRARYALPPLRKPDGKKSPPQRDQIYMLARAAGAQPFRSHDGRPFIDLPVDCGGRRTVPLGRGGGIVSWLTEIYTRQVGHLPSSQAVTDTLKALNAFARSDEAPVQEVFVRVGDAADLVVLDLGWPDGRCAVVRPTGWEVSLPPDGLRFLRNKSKSSALPEPARGAAQVMAAVRKVFEPVLEAADDLVLLIAWLFGCIMPGRGKPHLALTGPQGAGKTSNARALKSWIDPVPTKDGASGAPREVRSLVALAAASHMLVLDNLSSVGDALSDAICRLSTGGDIDDRRLYTDAELYTLQAIRPCIMTSIPDVGGNPDLRDRSICVALRTPRPRVTEARLGQAVADAAPAVLGGLLDAAVLALRGRDALPSLGDDLRLADFAAWVVAGAGPLGIDPEVFLAAYRENRQVAAVKATEGNVILASLVSFASRPSGWAGTMDQLFAALNEAVPASDRPKGDWPRTARHLIALLGRFEPVLHAAHGVSIERPKGSPRIWRLHRTGGDSADYCDTASSPLLTASTGEPVGTGEEPVAENPNEPDGVCAGSQVITGSPVLSENDLHREEVLIGCVPVGKGTGEGEAMRETRERSGEAVEGSANPLPNVLRLPGIEVRDGKVIL
ncbi:toprim domain-containing protein [Myxococcota bacterium]